MIQPFSVNIPQPILDDLKLRLKQVRWPINSYPNFTAEINGHQIHFLHIRGIENDQFL